MKIVKNGFKNERLGVELDVYIINGKEWFKAQDISNHLDYIQASDMLRNIDFIEDNTIKHNMLSDKGNYTDTRFINEIALYECVLKIRDSKTDLVKHNRYLKAREFQRWVFEEVLPSLRKNNYYIDKDNITKEQANKAIEYLLDLCDCGKLSLGKASMKIFGNKSELKNRLITLGLLDFKKCRFKQVEFTASNGQKYPLFVCNTSGTYEDRVAKHQLQVSITNAGYVWLKDKINENKDFGLESGMIGK